MGRIAEAARAIAWMSDDTWRRVRSGLAGPDAAAALGGRDRSATAWPSATARSSSRSRRGTASTRCGFCVSVPRPRAVTCRSSGSTLDRLRAVPIAAARRRGRAKPVTCSRTCCSPAVPTIGVVEALDHHGLWEQLVPEWTAVRSRPQHNPYHRFTVDRHLLETIANAERAGAQRRAAATCWRSRRCSTTSGKTGDRDHTEVGVELVVDRRCPHRVLGRGDRHPARAGAPSPSARATSPAGATSTTKRRSTSSPRRWDRWSRCTCSPR